MLNKKVKFFGIIVLFISLAITMSACDMGGNGVETDNGDEVIWDFYSGTDFGFDYPSEWITTSNHEQLNLYQAFFGDMYSSGIIAGPSTEFEKLFMIISLNVEEYQDYPINNADLNDFISSFHQTHTEVTDAVLVEESSLAIDGNPAIELIYEYTEDKASWIATYQGYKFYLIAYGCDKTEYNNMLSLFREIRDSISLY